jgi:outer membrane protein assembly factor BamD (BamD/ComL family)
MPIKQKTNNDNYDSHNNIQIENEFYNDVHALYNKGLSLYNVGRFNQAIKFYDNIWSSK